MVEFLDENSLDSQDPPKIRHNVLSDTPGTTRNSTPASSSVANSPMTTNSAAISPAEQNKAEEPFVAIAEEDYGPVPEDAAGKKFT